MTRVVVMLIVTLVAVAPLVAQRGMRVSTDVECAAILGVGAKTRRTFCDVLIGTRPPESIAAARR